MENRKLLFIYNADSSLEHKVFDFLHKAVSPSTYQCSLCAITYGTFTMRNDWREFLSLLSIPVEFLYRNEFRSYYTGQKMQYPVILFQKEKELEQLVTAEELKTLDLDGLKQLLSRRISSKV